MSAWLGFPLEEGHSGEKIKLRKTGQRHMAQGVQQRLQTDRRQASPRAALAASKQISPITSLLPKHITKRSQAFQSHVQTETESLERVSVTFSLWV